MSVVMLAVMYFLLIFTIGSNLFARGELELIPYLSSHALVFINIVMGLLYIAYTAYYRGMLTFAYENTDFKRLPLYMGIGIVLHFLLAAFQTHMFSVSLIYALLLGSAYTFVAFTENAFFIGVVGDYVYEKTRNELVASVASGLAAVLYHLGVYGTSGIALFVVFAFFAYWAFASFRTRSTLYADLHHALGNYIGFIYSVTRVIT